MEDFSVVANEYTPMIHHIIRSLSIYKNKDDFFQIGLIALWESYEKFNDDKGKFSNFAYTVIKGRIINELKRHHKYETHIRPFDAATLEVKAPFAMHEEAFVLENILIYTETLTLNQQRWLLQTFIGHKTISEIADMYQVTTAAVNSWRKSALHKLRKKADFAL
ncbi:sigma-70 family RNA polymerase sigma factor [Peribacillus sp. NPDC060186]